MDKIRGIAFCAVVEPIPTADLNDVINVLMFGNIYYKVRVIHPIDPDHVWLGYISIEFFHRLQVIVELGNLRIIFESCENSVILKHCGVHLVYTYHEENVDAHLDIALVDEDIRNSANPRYGFQLSKKCRVDDNDDDDDCCNIESD